MKPHVKDLKCFNQVSDVIGKSRAQIELFKVVNNPKLDWFHDKNSVASCFSWRESPQGGVFWSNIEGGINPYETEEK